MPQGSTSIAAVTLDGEPELLEVVRAPHAGPPSRAAWTAGKSKAISKPMTAMTTSSSIKRESVMPTLRSTHMTSCPSPSYAPLEDPAIPPDLAGR